jgi:enhancing lycopene biosynthesis protein 2
VAVVLSGSGVYDGSEVHEAAACLSALTRGGATPVVFAPDVKQAHVVDHQTGQEASADVRMVLSEAARIARGAVTPLAQLKASSDIKYALRD